METASQLLRNYVAIKSFCRRARFAAFVGVLRTRGQLEAYTSKA